MNNGTRKRSGRGRGNHFGALALVGLAAGCGESGVPYEQFVVEYTAAYCDLRVDCGWFPDSATCLDVGVRSLVELRAAGAFIEHGTIAFDGQRAAACLDELAAMSCDRTSFARIPLDQRGLCRSSLRGRVPVGGSCVLAAECEDDAWCSFPDDCTAACCAGTCLEGPVFPSTEIGEACGESTPACVAGAFCPRDPMSGEWGRCEPLRTEGASCEMDEMCVGGTTCAGGRCRRYVTEGGACGDARGSCDRFDNVCAEASCRRAPLPGESCADSPCIGYAFCGAGAICSLEPMPGEPCTDPDANGLRRCLGDAACGGEVCVALDATECRPPGS